MKRVVLYAAVYGGIGVVVGVLMALYTQDTNLENMLTAKPTVTAPTTVEETPNEMA